MTRIDYDALAGQYLQNRRVHPGVLQRLTAHMPPEHPGRVLEVGCGTANYLLAACSASGWRGWGLDPSARMLAAACARQGDAGFVQGTAEALPLAQSACDLVFSVDVIHHVQGRERFFREAARVLRPGGWVCTVTDDEALIQARVPLSSHFPETVAFELERYPRLADLRGWMQAAGFTALEEEVVRLPYLLTDLRPYAEKAFSSLHLISTEAWQAGMDRLRASLASGPLEAVSHYLLLWGQKA